MKEEQDRIPGGIGVRRYRGAALRDPIVQKKTRHVMIANERRELERGEEPCNVWTD